MGRRYTLGRLSGVTYGDILLYHVLDMGVKTHKVFATPESIDGLGNDVTIRSSVVIGGEFNCGIIVNAKLHGGFMLGGEFNGGVLYGGEIYGGQIMDTKMFGGGVVGGNLTSCILYDGCIYGGNWVCHRIFLGDITGGEINTPVEIYGYHHAILTSVIGECD